VLEALVLPIVADLQYEDSQARRGGVTRLVTRLRHYIGLASAMGLHDLCDRRASMTQTRLVTSLRWLIMIPAALLASRVTQDVVFQLAGLLLFAAVGREGWGWTTWAGKCAATPFMGASFVAAVWWLAPVRKAFATAVALGVVVLWGGMLMFGAFAQGIADFNGWLFAMGLSGVLGGVVTWWLARRSIQRALTAA
jgi:hypothetical protein